MPSRLQIDRASIADNDVARQVEFVGEVDGEEIEFAVGYGVLAELSGDEPEGDAIEIFERHEDEIADVCVDVLERRPGAVTVVIGRGDLE